MVALLLAAVALGRRATPEFAINLDDPPEVRFRAVTTAYNSTIQLFYATYFANDWPLRAVVYEISQKRGAEVPELAAEIHAVAQLTGLPEWGIHAMQLLYPLQTTMVPIVNGSTKLYKGVRFPWHRPSCTGIIATDSTDGSVWHARNLDFSPAPFMQKLVYSGVFSRGGKVLFRAQMMAGYSLPLTGLRYGSNGYSFETNTRYPNEGDGGDEGMLHNLFVERRLLNGWQMRKVLENVADYETAVAQASTVPLVATEYIIMSGIRKGTILARDPDRTANAQVLGQVNPQCRSDYIIITNFDYFFGDIREWFDPTGGQIGRPRRLVAQRILNATAVLTPQALFSTIDAPGTIATDTIFQATISVEKGVWNTSLPACADC